MQRAWIHNRYLMSAAFFHGISLSGKQPLFLIFIKNGQKDIDFSFYRNNGKELCVTIEVLKQLGEQRMDDFKNKTGHYPA